ncbi:thioredoxin family protein [Tenacibaculum halocynthiae]|uniref:thioredoxin family protein n=1 Tax=Tenacibaculum halocynthiae TaxID=1254437 RepID=UPI003D64CDEF
MKKIITFLVLLFAVNIVFSQNGAITDESNKKIKVTWEASYKEALKKSKKEKKPVLIYFTGSDWCGPCIKLDRELFHTSKFVEYANENMILYMANFPRNKDLVTKEVAVVNKRLSKKYKNSFPMVLLIDKREKVLGEKRGSYMTEYYYPFFEAVIKKHYKKNPK